MQMYFTQLNLTAILNMLQAILQASFSEFLNEIELGTWIPLGVFVLRDISVTDRKGPQSDLRLVKTAGKSF